MVRKIRLIRQKGTNRWFKSMDQADFINFTDPEEWGRSIPCLPGVEGHDFRYVADPYYTRFVTTAKQGARYSMSENDTEAIEMTLTILKQLFPNDEYVVETYQVEETWKLQ